METLSDEAPAGRGLPARWISTAKTGVGMALSPASRVWFILSHGILLEIYYPRLDHPCWNYLADRIISKSPGSLERRRLAPHPGN